MGIVEVMLKIWCAFMKDGVV